MEKIPVIYWSGTGNTKLMAEAVAEGIGTAADLKSVSDITPEQAAEYSALALGCSAMGAEVLEEYEFEPFFTALEPFLQGKKVVIFGSYGCEAVLCPLTVFGTMNSRNRELWRSAKELGKLRQINLDKSDSGDILIYK